MIDRGIFDSKKHSHRGNIYRLLAECYRYPTEQLGDNLEFLAEETQQLDSGLCNWTQEMKRRFDPSASGLAQLGVAHAKLFIGPFQLLAAPYGSVYLDENHRAMGSSTMQVIQFYMDAGLHPSTDNKEPPDHISTELEFVYYLVFRYLETGNRRYFKDQKTFVLREMSHWVPQFVKAIWTADVHPFYNSLASLTNDFLRWDASLLDQRQ